MARVLLVVPSATYRAAAFLAAAARLGTEVVIASDQPQALAEAMSDRFLEVDLARPEAAAAAICELARRRPLDAVVAVDDQGAVPAALAAARLGLRASPAEAVARTRDKAAMRRAFERAGVAQPRFRVAGRDDAALAAAGEALGYPVVVKPVSLAGSRGVIRADDERALRAAGARLRAILAEAGAPDEPVLVESYVPGGEVALEGLLLDGRLEVLAVFDKPDPLEGPYFAETLYVTPSRLAPELVGALGALAGRACAALGLSDGPVHAELRLAGEERDHPVVLEVAARTIGGRCSGALDFGGTSLEELVLLAALSRQDLVRQRGALRPAAVLMLPVARTGVLRAVHGVDDALALEGVTGCEITVPIGQRVRALPEADRYLGFLFAEGATPAAAEAAARAGYARLGIEIDPERAARRLAPAGRAPCRRAGAGT
ncbi:MAG TPA: ATP-grasp domain-containing protein [Acidimicrobiales bacterium]|nr:ATP-grasp domain-containing protein [Acidimicrobiales bacterium]